MSTTAVRPIFGDLLRSEPRPVLPLFGYTNELNQPLLVLAIGQWNYGLVVLFPTHGVAEQRMHPAHRGARIVELETPSDVASYLRRSGAWSLSVDVEPLWSEPHTYCHRRPDCPVRVADALEILR